MRCITTKKDDSLSDVDESTNKSDVYCGSNGTDDPIRKKSLPENDFCNYSPNSENICVKISQRDCLPSSKEKQVKSRDELITSEDTHKKLVYYKLIFNQLTVGFISVEGTAFTKDETAKNPELPETPNRQSYSDTKSTKVLTEELNAMDDNIDLKNETETRRRSTRINEKPAKISTHEKNAEETKVNASLKKARKSERDSDTDVLDCVGDNTIKSEKIIKSHKGKQPETQVIVLFIYHNKALIIYQILKIHSTKRGRGAKDVEVKESEENGEPVQRVLRGRIMKTPAKPQTSKGATSVRRGRLGKVDREKVIDADDKFSDLDDTETMKTPTRKGPSRTKVPKRQMKSDEHDPYDIDTEMEKHPEPLKNIQVFAIYAKGRSKKSSEIEGTDFDEDAIGNSEGSPRELKIGRMNFSTIQKTPISASRKRRGSPPSVSLAKRSNIVDIPDLDSESQWAVDHPGDEHAPHENGARVYALFDKVFYPAVVASRDGLGRFKVRFTEDGMVKDVPPAGVIPLRALIADKECLLTDSVSGDEPLPVRVLISPNAASAVDWQKGVFQLEILDDEGKVRHDTDPISAQWNKLSLDMAEWKEYINKKSIEATQVIADNIATTEDRHSRRSKLANFSVTTPSLNQKGQKTAENKSLTTPSVLPKSPAKGMRRSVKKLSTPPPQLDEKPCIVEQAIEEDTATSKPITPIFSGKLFILTSANRPHAEGAPGFKKKFMTDFIVSRGGLVVDDVHEVDAHPEKEWFLISDTHYRTHKYLAAMARAMPCVSHEWILKCLSQDELVSYTNYLLPSGVSILDNQTYELYIPCTYCTITVRPKERGVLLKDKRVMVHSNHQPTNPKALSFVQIWQPMIGLLGGEVVLAVPTEPGSLDVLLTDGSATPSVVEAARCVGAHVVSSEWLIQAIIMSKLPDVDANIRFKHDGGAGDRA
uniref:BRCT domain-containing protein n=1 Tax=Heterorhabditis bacteriophora TaxID=37862 RepID=A0A1I7XGT8_HETBA